MVNRLKHSKLTVYSTPISNGSDITATLTNLIVEGTCSHSSLLDAYVALHAGLVACLHKIIGVELGKYITIACYQP